MNDDPETTADIQAAEVLADLLAAEEFGDLPTADDIASDWDYYHNPEIPF
jgi:hypothetical protein